MRRLILAFSAIAAVAGPMAMATTAEAQGRGYSDRDRSETRGWDRNDRRDNDRRSNDRWDNNRRDNGRWDNDRRDNRRWDNNNRWDNNRRDNRRDDRWDNRRHNGYSYNNRWYYGPPPQAYYGRPGFYPGYQAWQRGGYLPRSYWHNTYVIRDYPRYRLRHPPRGYHWINANGDYVLAAIATGLILEAISNR